MVAVVMSNAWRHWREYDGLQKGFCIGILLVFAAFGAMAYHVEWVEKPRYQAWADECAAKGGTPVPTSVSVQSGGSQQYGRYICAKLVKID